MESQEQSPGDVVTAGEDSHPITQAIDTVEVTHAGATTPAANTMDPPTIPLAPMKRMQARFNPLADGLMYVVVFVGGFVGVGEPLGAVVLSDAQTVAKRIDLLTHL